ncbi:MAG: inorganic phosphate transporter [Candidatus Latescibacteria bacterium]|nr:inorganic phosphate transporter [Candidatus Latescibacterota bacterium]
MTVLVIGIVASLYIAWSIGSNDVANSMGTSVAAESLSFRQAVIIAGILNFLGAVLVGSRVVNTVRKGIINPNFFADNPSLLVYGMISALLAAAIWITLATYLRLPVSTTHSIVGAIVGFGLITVGITGIRWSVILFIILSWIISPLFGALISFVIFSIIRSKVLSTETPLLSFKKIGPIFVALTGMILTLAVISIGMRNLNLRLPLYVTVGIALAVAGVSGWSGYLFLRKYRPTKMTQTEDVEELSKPLQAMSASYEAFAHGSNDVANAVGPVAAVFSIIATQSVKMKTTVPIWMLAVGGVGLVIGIATWGHRVMETIGRRITEITPTRGFAAEFSAATTVLLCSCLGLPVSTTHVSVGTVLGVGFARGVAALNLRVVRNIVLSWLLTLPVAAGLSSLIFRIMVKIHP